MGAYKVGQILFVVLRKEATVYPLQIVEEITKKTLEGEVVTYMVRAGSASGPSENVLSITEIDGELFDNAERARRTLTERASSSIAQRVEHAVTKAKEWYPSGFESSSDDPLQSIKKQAVAAKAPPQTKPVKKALSNVAAELAAELQHDSEALESTTVELADGTKMKVGSITLPDVLQR